MQLTKANILKEIDDTVIIRENNRAYHLLYSMPFKKGTSGNPIGRPKGSLSTTSKLIREHISQAIDGNK